MALQAVMLRGPWPHCRRCSPWHQLPRVPHPLRVRFYSPTASYQANKNKRQIRAMPPSPVRFEDLDQLLSAARADPDKSASSPSQVQLQFYLLNQLKDYKANSSRRPSLHDKISPNLAPDGTKHFWEVCQGATVFVDGASCMRTVGKGKLLGTKPVKKRRRPWEREPEVATLVLDQLLTTLLPVLHEKAGRVVLVSPLRPSLESPLPRDSLVVIPARGYQQKFVSLVGEAVRSDDPPERLVCVTDEKAIMDILNTFTSPLIYSCLELWPRHFQFKKKLDCTLPKTTPLADAWPAPWPKTPPRGAVPMDEQDTSPEYAPAPSYEYAPAPSYEYAPAPRAEYAPAPRAEYAPAPRVEYAPAPRAEYAPAPRAASDGRFASGWTRVKSLLPFRSRAVESPTSQDPAWNSEYQPFPQIKTRFGRR